MALLDKRDYFKPLSYPWALDYFDTHERMHWLWTEVPLEQDIKDWEFKLSDAERNLLTQLFRFFTQADCYSEDTEVLTSSGWKKIKDVSYLDKVVQSDKNFKVSFTHPERIIEKEHSGDMYFFGDQRGRTNLLVTPDHKMIYSYKNETKVEKAKNTLFYQGKKHHVTSKGVKGTGRGLRAIELLAISFQADGNFKKDVNGDRLEYLPVRYSFSKDRKIKRLERLLNESGISWEYENDLRENHTSFKVYWPLGESRYLSKDFGWASLEDLGEEGSKEFIEELSYWDSHIDKWGNITYSNTNKSACDIVQAVCVLAGYNCNFTEYIDSRSDEFSNVFSLTIRKKGEEVDGQSIRRHQKTIKYSGKVYCLTVPDGFLVTRRGEAVAISGNCDVASGYYDKFIPLIGKQPEIKMMMGSFAGRENIHIRAYSMLVDEIGMPESEYQAFHEYKEMADKHEYMDNFHPDIDDKQGIAEAMAVYAAFTEGMQLFSSFIILMNFAVHGKMKAMDKIVQWSIRDESIHVEGMIKLFKTFCREYSSEINIEELEKSITRIAVRMVQLEDQFIKLAFEQGGIEGLHPHMVEEYIRYIADIRLKQLGFEPFWNVPENPLPEELIAKMNAVEHTNFFENRATDYSKGNLQGKITDWG